MSNFRFILCPVLSSIPFGELELSNVSFTESVDGKGTVLTADAFVSSTQSAEKLKTALNYPDDPKGVAVYVKNGSQFLWGGVIQTRPWSPDKRAFTITATSWKAWLYQRYLSPDVTTNPVTDSLYAWVDTDQFTIARDIVAFATSEDGTPTITTGTDLSGVERDLTVNASDFVYAGEAIDRMADRERGFEWDIEIRTSGTLQYPSLYLAMYYPKRQEINSTVMFSSDDTGGNIVDFSSPDDSAENVITRVWGTGSGTAGADLLIAYDQADFSDGRKLLIETKEYSNSSTTEITTVASHVQGIRSYHSSGLQQVTVKISLSDPDFNLYRVGNKVRLVIKDDVLDIDYKSVRIVRRTFTVNADGSASEDLVELMIDLNDTNLPEDEEAI